MYWLCARCGETYYTSAGVYAEEEWPCDVCGSVTGAKFDDDPEVASPAHLLVDEDGRILALSRDLERLTGWTEIEAIGMAWEDMTAIVGPAAFRELETLSGSWLVECHVGVRA